MAHTGTTAATFPNNPFNLGSRFAANKKARPEERA
jgi:hypothetical protein